jgi:hypothetical protein
MAKNSPGRKEFVAHRYHAKQRNIPFEFTYEQWWDMWQASGHWYERGNRKGKYCMARFGDKGPCAVGNVRIIKFEDNTRELVFNEEMRAKCAAVNIGKTISEETRAKMSAAGRAEEVLAKKLAANIGKKHTDEARANMRSAAAKKNRSPFSGRFIPKESSP